MRSFVVNTSTKLLRSTDRAAVVVCFAARSTAMARDVMTACATAHHWLRGLGIQVQLMPAQYVRAYVRRNKTDAAGAAALLEAACCAEICPVRVKSVEQQALQTYRITSSARSKIDGWIARPKADAVLRLTTNSNFVGSSTGKSAGFAPKRMRATRFRPCPTGRQDWIQT